MTNAEAAEIQSDDDSHEEGQAAEGEETADKKLKKKQVKEEKRLKRKMKKELKMAF